MTKGLLLKRSKICVMERFIPSIPGEVELFSNEDVCIISKEEVGNRPIEQGGG